MPTRGVGRQKRGKKGSFGGFGRFLKKQEDYGRLDAPPIFERIWASLRSFGAAVVGAGLRAGVPAGADVGVMRSHRY
jgi:hypothetical protein